MKRVTMLFAAGLILLAAAALPTIRAGAQPAVVTDDNLDQMITNAKTASAGAPDIRCDDCDEALHRAAEERATRLTIF